MKRVLVTGSGGYIGRHVVSKLLDMGHQVIACDICNDGVDDRAEKREISIFEAGPGLYEELGRPDVCIHLAWRNGFVHNADTHMGDLSGHFHFIKNLLDAGLKNIAIMGSMHEVGYFEGAIKEDSPCNPLSQYGIAKNALRQSIMQMVEGTDVNLYWLRAYYILGDDTRNHSIFTKIIEMDAKGEKLFPFTSGKNKYDFITVDLLAEYIALASTQTQVTGIINVCTGQPKSLGDRVEEFIKERNLSIRLNYGAFPDREYDSPGVWGDVSKINEIIEASKE
ncbi:MAG TPA: NAD(P)-dependent oxidoreductase [Lachnospiraceae bacterium]